MDVYAYSKQSCPKRWLTQTAKNYGYYPGGGCSLDLLKCRFAVSPVFPIRKITVSLKCFTVLFTWSKNAYCFIFKNSLITFAKIAK